ncbi:MAG TPA: hypothetical protein VG937_16660 [Polyangiaceae bacterium]|jgi:hypothetical protein|nr:hypothetical protein [Polyangiaceae bacterium]
MNDERQIGSVPRAKVLIVLSGTVIAVAVAASLAVRARAAGIPPTNALSYSGYLETPDGTPVVNQVEVALNVWDAASGGHKVCAVANQTLTPSAGHFRVELPDACTRAVSANPNLWLEPVINDTSLGRTGLGAVPYSVEADHAVSADVAAPTGALAERLNAMQAEIDRLKARLDQPLTQHLAKVMADKITVPSMDWMWISGTDSATLAPGRYWVFNTARAYASNLGCSSNCQPLSSVVLTSCMRVGSQVTAAASYVVAEVPWIDGSAASLPASAIDYFDIDKETADVRLGLCARRLSETGAFHAVVADAYSAVIAQLR